MSAFNIPAASDAAAIAKAARDAALIATAARYGVTIATAAPIDADTKAARAAAAKAAVAHDPVAAAKNAARAAMSTDMGDFNSSLDAITQACTAKDKAARAVEAKTAAAGNPVAAAKKAARKEVQSTSEVDASLETIEALFAAAATATVRWHSDDASPTCATPVCRTGRSAKW